MGWGGGIGESMQCDAKLDRISVSLSHSLPGESRLRFAHHRSISRACAEAQ